MRIYIIGYMGSGKSTVSEKLAKKLNLLRFDLDELFEQRFKVDISSFFDKYDETLFRKFESLLLKETLLLNNVVISTGGGTPCFYNNMEWMKQFGITVYLEMNAKSLLSRLQASKKKRPLMQDKNTADQLLEFIQNHMRKRDIWYSQADIIVKGESLDVELPITVDLEVTEAPPGFAGDTAQGATKEVTLETGLKINVPLFIQEGDVLRIDTRDGRYVTRV